MKSYRVLQSTCFVKACDTGISLHASVDHSLRFSWLNRRTYGFKESFVTNGLSEECKRTTLKSLSAEDWVVVSRYEDDRHAALNRGQLLL